MLLLIQLSCDCEIIRPIPRAWKDEVIAVGLVHRTLAVPLDGMGDESMKTSHDRVLVVVKAQNDLRRCSIDVFLCPIAIALASRNAYLEGG